MSRLIDADRLRMQFVKPTDWVEANRLRYSVTGVLAIIDSAPTVADAKSCKNHTVFATWENIDDVIFLCSRCKHASARTPFCAWCGADMWSETE